MKFKQAPLPFIGQKRRFLKNFETLLNQCIADDGKGWTIVDVFGGSGLLAHTAKQLKPQARVIYNDFDNYAERLKHIDDTNRLRKIIFDLLKDLPREKRLPEHIKSQVKTAILQFNGYVDVKTLATWLLFGGRQVIDLNDLLNNHDFYHCVRLSDYHSAGGYLDGLEITQQSFDKLLPEFLGKSKVLLVLDPPYISTSQGMYANENYFGMVEFLRLMRFVKPPFIFFSSTRSEFVDYLDFVVSEKAENWQNFADYQRLSFQVAINRIAKYEDNLVYKFA